MYLYFFLYWWNVFKILIIILLLVVGDQYREASRYYDLAKNLLEVRDSIWSLILSYQTPSKLLAPGRVVLINYRYTTEVFFGSVATL